MNPQVSQIQLDTLTVEELTNLKEQATAAVALLNAQILSAKASAKVSADRFAKQITVQTVNISKIDDQIAVLNTPVNPA